jgi:hypothetical protein
MPTPIRQFVSLADPVGDELPQPFEIVGKDGISRALGGGRPQADFTAAMAQQAQDLVNLLSRCLPQGTWARVVALVARKWADDQAGILASDRMGGRTTWRVKTDRRAVQLAIEYLTVADDKMMPGEPGRAEVEDALRLLGLAAEADRCQPLP